MIDFSDELQRRLDENRKLYGGSEKKVYDPVLQLVAGSLGVNPWKVIVPVSIFIVLFLRVFLGPGFSEAVLRVLGG